MSPRMHAERIRNGGPRPRAKDEKMARQSTLAFLLPILLVCAAILAVYSFLPRLDAGAGDGQQGGAISLSIAGGPLVDGNNATLRAVSTCGAFDVLLDGQEFGKGALALNAHMALKEGNHTANAYGNGCNSTLAFAVTARECAGDRTEACARDGCSGTRQCIEGRLSSCALPKKICSPGEKIGCTTNGCAFGYATCNQCGTGFGKCLPGLGGSNSSAPCSGANCN